MIRCFDALFSGLGIIVLSPVFLVVYIAIRLESKGGGLYKQVRVGRYGKDFYLYKFRSMRTGADKQGLITIGGHDPRITRVGYVIRKYKLDELPQLFNVLRGDMSLVGPRPEVRKYVDLYTEEQRRVLSVRPGITDYASITYVDENSILGAASNPDEIYVEQIMPDKIKQNMQYINCHSVKEYFKIIFLTFWHIIDVRRDSLVVS
jgi:lipopolysaccharide/colanic/teichoic acid biosynthesis glycosyltransferase